MNPLLLSDLEIQINVSKGEQLRRSDICSICPHFTPSQNVSVEIVNAETGELQIVNVFKFENCDVDNVSLIGFLPLKTSTCPEGKW
jgi:hypothetical protein